MTSYRRWVLFNICLGTCWCWCFWRESAGENDERSRLCLCWDRNNKKLVCRLIRHCHIQRYQNVNFISIYEHITWSSRERESFSPARFSVCSVPHWISHRTDRDRVFAVHFSGCRNISFYLLSSSKVVFKDFFAYSDYQNERKKIN